MSDGGPSTSEFAALELRDRAAQLLAERGAVAEDELLAHVYGGAPPSALRAQLARPLLADSRLERHADGWWSLRVSPPERSPTFTALALVSTGPNPRRARIVRLSALRVDHGRPGKRFDVLVNPQVRVPRWALARLGVEIDALDSQPTLADAFEELQRFLADRPILTQDAQLTWAFLANEARRLGRALATPPLLDLNELATQRLQLKTKPSLSLVAAQLGIASLHIDHPDEEARVLALVGARLLAVGAVESAPERGADQPATTRPLRRADTARSLPDEPGVYVLRDSQQTPLYVGKARRLRSRMAAYVHRPLGPTRRLEGLVGSVESVESLACQTDLDALILEDREIRRLQPRYNTVRLQRSPRVWIRLPPWRFSARGKPLAPPRLELAHRPGSGEADVIGPFRNETLADQARCLAREVFDLDRLRQTDLFAYRERLAQAWRFLHGDRSLAEALARRHSLELLRKVLVFDLGPLLLPADPRQAGYVVLRPSPRGLEGFRIHQGQLLKWGLLETQDLVAALGFAHELLQPAEPRTTADDVDVVLRWLGAQRPNARLIHLPEDPLRAADLVEDAVLELLAAGKA